MTRPHKPPRGKGRRYCRAKGCTLGKLHYSHSDDKPLSAREKNIAMTAYKIGLHEAVFSARCFEVQETAALTGQKRVYDVCRRAAALGGRKGEG